VLLVQVRQDQLAPGAFRVEAAEGVPVGEAALPELALAFFAHAGHVKVAVTEHTGILAGTREGPC
jgi:hypothetical protein